MNVLTADETGLLKHVDVEKKSVLSSFGVQSRSQGINHMDWVDPFDETRGIICACDDASIKFIRDFELVDAMRVDSISEGCSGIELFENRLFTCSTSGSFQVFNFDDSKEHAFGKDIVKEFHVGNGISRMRRSGVSGLFGTGGKDNEMTLWDVDGKAVFRAKNVPHDFLEMKVPVWVTDFCFFPVDGTRKSLSGGIPELVVACTAFSQLRVYDTRAQRRPVKDAKFGSAAGLHENSSSTSSLHMNRVISVSDHTVVVADAGGMVYGVDIRTMKEVSRYKLFAGSVRSIVKHPTLPYIASVGLDRHLLVHNIDTKQLLSKVYLKQRLSCVLFSAEEGTHKITKKRKSKKTDQDQIEDLSEDDAVVSDDENEITEEVTVQIPKVKKKKTKKL